MRPELFSSNLDLTKLSVGKTPKKGPAYIDQVYAVPSAGATAPAPALKVSKAMAKRAPGEVAVPEAFSNWIVSPTDKNANLDDLHDILLIVPFSCPFLV